MEKTNNETIDKQRVSIPLPIWMVRSVDKEAGRIGITRQSLIKMWLADKLDHLQHN